MRLLGLHLEAFGPFTDLRLDLSAGDAGLHIVYGPNEAGKSSALRALRGLLFGIPERSADDFLHPKERLRIGGRLRLQDGQELTCYRRKGRLRTLLDAAGEPLPDELLARALGGVDEPLFSALFGIDYLTLSEGGAELLREQGREGEALFGSGLGSTGLRALLDTLDREAGELFAPRASKPSLNAELRRLQELQKGIREAALAPQEWEERRRALEGTREEEQAAEVRLKAARGELARMERMRRTAPRLARRGALLQGIEGLAGVRLLDEGFPERRRRAVERQERAMVALGGAEARLGSLRQALAGLPAADGLLPLGAEIDALYERNGEYRAALRERPLLRARGDSLGEEITAALRQIEPAGGAEIQPLLGRLAHRRELQGVAGRESVLRSRLEESGERAAIAARRCADAGRVLEGLPPPAALDGLRAALDAARREGDLDRLVAEAEGQVSTLEREVGQGLLGLGPWSAGLEALQRAVLPHPDAIARFEQRFDTLAAAAQRRDESRARLQGQQQEAHQVLRELELAGEVPEVAQLAAARGERDRIWGLLRGHWVEGAEIAGEAVPFGGVAALPDRFEARTGEADRLADRLRIEADRVHRFAAARAQLEGAAAELERLSVDAETAGQGQAALLEEWGAIWPDLAAPPGPPREMRGWLERARRLQGQAAELDAARGRVQGLSGRRELHRARLAEAGIDLADSASQEIAPLLDRAQGRIAEAERQGRLRAQAEADLAQQVRALQEAQIAEAAAQQALAVWREEWQGLRDRCGLPETIGPAGLADHLEGLDRLDRLQGERRRNAEEVARLDGVVAGFEAETDRLLQAAGLGQPEGALDEAVGRLHARVVEERARESRRGELERQLTVTRGEIAGIETELAEARAELGRLCAEAGCPEVAGLEAAEQGSERLRTLRGELVRLEADLLAGGDGLDLAALQAEIAGRAPEEIEAERHALADRIARELEPERDRLLERRIHEERGLAELERERGAAGLQEEAEECLARIHTLATDYVRVRLASRVLRDEIERFRARHRHPILQATGDYLRRLTLDAFSGVGTDYDSADELILTGLRADGAALRVEQMSTGTRDQLYLALRLATLEHYLDRNEPLPFVVDDILVQFDDDRSRATLEALARLGRRTQVLLFTHHRRVVEQGEGLGEGQGVFVHRLRRG